MMTQFALFMFLVAASPLPPDLRAARNKQDRAALDKLAESASTQVQAKPADPGNLSRAALAELIRAEVLLELRDRNAARGAAESGIRHAERLVEIQPKSAEAHRLLGALCGQVIPANVLAGLKYGKCALEEVNRAIEIDPKSSDAWMSHAVGNFYLPPSFGGGADKALADIDKALQLDAKSADAWFWKGLILRKLNRNAEARQALEKSLVLNPDRLWARQQLEKTPAQ
ncbi:MAG: tetratricopeptide repeat protein [Bryobacter sp.]|jgi:tetratricopeptide (TPR) repeat protein|nr:tetratricopeptide repeat protein [Bryobacter sp.]